jgi:hypothetical protein
MRLTKEEARQALDIYIRAWEGQDPDLIVTIFTESATYHERVLEDPIPDRDAIRRYWQEKVVQSQANIKCELLNLYLDGTTVIAEWEAEFDDLTQGVRKRMREIAVLVFEGRLISSLREYWASEQIGQVKRHTPLGLHHQDAADVLAVAHVLVALVDVLKGVSAGDHPVQVKEPVLVQVEQARHVGAGVH